MQEQREGPVGKKPLSQVCLLRAQGSNPASSGQSPAGTAQPWQAPPSPCRHRPLQEGSAQSSQDTAHSWPLPQQALPSLGGLCPMVEMLDTFPQEVVPKVIYGG